MAADDQDLELDLEVGKETGGGSGGNKKLIIIIAAAVLLIGGGAAAFFMMGDDSADVVEGASDEEMQVVEKGPAIYVGIPNVITANLPGDRKARTVQIKMSFLVRSEEAKEHVRRHMPQLKNDVLMLVSQKNAEELKLPEGRRKLQQQALATVQKTLTELVGEPTVEKVLFISFVMQ